LGEALAMCPSLELVEQDPAEAGQAWEGVVLRLEDEGFAVELAGVGCLYFETRGLERLYGGVAGVLQRALAALGSSWDARAGAAALRPRSPSGSSSSRRSATSSRCTARSPCWWTGRWDGRSGPTEP